MFIQLQGNGEVYGLFPIPETVPPTPLDTNEFAVRLKSRLEDMTRVIEVVGDDEDRVLVNLELVGSLDVDRFYEAVGLVAVEHLLPSYST